MATWQVVALGCLGGMLPDVLRVISNRYDPQTPAYFRSLQFWAGFIFLVVLGGGVAALLGAAEAIQALAYGFAAPELISKVTGAYSSQVEASTKARLEWEEAQRKAEREKAAERREVQRKAVAEARQALVDAHWRGASREERDALEDALEEALTIAEGRRPAARGASAGGRAAARPAATFSLLEWWAR